MEKAWYLPDRYPVFWNEMRRRFVGRRRVVSIIVGGVVLLTVVAMNVIFIIAAYQSVKKYGPAEDGSLQYLLHPQSFLLWLFCPLMAADAITTERQRRLLDMLFLTPISSRSLAAC